MINYWFISRSQFDQYNIAFDINITPLTLFVKKNACVYCVKKNTFLYCKRLDLSFFF